MAIGDDFTIYPATKVIRHTANNNVYTVQQFYSWIMDTFDEPGYMTYTTPMKYNTPTSYTMLNGWFLDNGDGSDILKYLKEGSIDTSGYTNDILVVTVDNLNDCISTDKDKTVVETGDVGPLLAYKNDSPSADLGKWWIRDTNSHGQIDNNDSMTITGGSGTADASANSATGDDIYTNLYTIGSFAGSPNPQVYLFQDGERIAEWSDKTNWDRGHIDILITIKEGGVEIDSGNVSVFVRQSGDSFTFAEADLSSGSRTPVAVETQADLNDGDTDTTGELYLLYDGEAGAGFSAGDVIQDTQDPPTFYAEVANASDWGTTGLLELRGVRGSIDDNASLFVSGAVSGLANGTLGDTFGTWSGDVVSPIAGDLGAVLLGGSSGAKRVLRGFQDDTGSGKFVCNVSGTPIGTNRDDWYRAYTNGENLTASGGSMDATSAQLSVTAIGGYSDVSIIHVNGNITATGAGTLIPGEKFTYDAGANSGNLVRDYGDGTLAIGNVTSPDTITGDVMTFELSGVTRTAQSDLNDGNTASFAFTQQAYYDYSVFVEGGDIYYEGRSVADIYRYLKYVCRDGESHTMYTSDNATVIELEGQEYIKADAAYTAVKAAPFGTLAGVLFFGAQGVWLEGMDSGDANNIKLTDDGGTLREPYTSVNVVVGNTVVGDSVAVYLKDGSADLPNKSQYTSHATNNSLSDSTFEKDAGSFPVDTPSDGTFIVVDYTANEEHRYRYTSWSGGILTMPTERTGTGGTNCASQTLVDTTADYVTWGTTRGDIIRNITDSGWGYVETVNSATNLTTTKLTTPAGDWANGDTYEMNSLVATYTASDNFFIPYMDEEAAGGSVTVNILYTTPRDTLIRVRDVGIATPIQPFETTSQITTTGMNVSTIRSEDEVYA